MDFGLSSVERYLPSSRLVYRRNKLPKTIIYLVPEALELGWRWSGRQLAPAPSAHKLYIMFVKTMREAPSFTASDATTIREVLHPKNEAVDLPYSLAHASLDPGAASLPHVLGRRSEVYVILEGEGTAFVGEESRRVAAGDMVWIPAGAKQYIRNEGEGPLHFLCIVAPPWAKEDDTLA